MPSILILLFLLICLLLTHPLQISPIRVFCQSYCTQMYTTRPIENAKHANNVLFTHTTNTSNISTLDFHSFIHHPPSRRNVYITKCKSITNWWKQSSELLNVVMNSSVGYHISSSSQAVGHRVWFFFCAARKDCPFWTFTCSNATSLRSTL